MFRNYFKTAYRSVLANGSYSLISLGSLVLGITLFFFITIWVKNEMSYDADYANGNSVFRIETITQMQDGQKSNYQTVGWPVGKSLTAKYPEIESLVYMRDWSPVINKDGNHFYEDALYADENFFHVMNFKLAEGNAATALKEPYSVVISETLAGKYFGNKDAVGKVIMINDTLQYKITGVLAGNIFPSHLKFDMIGSLATYYSMYPDDTKAEFTSGWFDLNMYNYVRLKKGVSAEGFESKMRDLVLRDGKEAVLATGFKPQLSLRPVSDIYLYSGMPTGRGAVSNIQTVKLFLLIGIFILLIACLNFINLTTAKSVDRAREIGIKKVLGSNRKKLIFQFLTETGLLCITASVISLLLMAGLLNVFNAFTGKAFALADLFSAGNLLLMLGIITVLIPVSGLYPAFVLSAFKPVSVLKGKFSHSSSGILLRKGLVVTQFVISAAFIMGTIVVWKQMQYMQQQDLGFDNDKIILVDVGKVPWALRHEKAPLLKTSLLGNTGVQSVTACNAVPGRSGWSSQFAYPEGKPQDAGIIVEYIPVDDDYAKTLGLQFVSGRDFMHESKTDEDEGLIINEAAVKTFGWNSAADAIGKKLSTSGKEGRVIGVLKNYHQHGLQEEIKPVVLGVANYVNVVAIRYSGIAPGQLITKVQNAWNEVYKGYSMQYSFMDEDFQKQYQKELKLQQFFGLAAALSIVIACMGLFGRAIFTAQKRTKEIGVRKVLGAGVADIVMLLSKDFLKLVTAAVVIAIPVAWIAMNRWLEDFAYRVSINAGVFLAAGFVAVLIALLTVSFRAVKAAVANPVKSLRTE